MDRKVNGNRMKSVNRTWLIIAALALTLAVPSVACNLLTLGRQTPGPPIPVTTQAVESLATAVEDAQQDGTVQLVLTEAQLTSLVALKLQEAGDETISNPQVYLRDGKIQVFGDVSLDNFQATAQVVISASVDSRGNAVFDIESGSLGPFPLPENVVSQLEGRLNTIFQEEIASAAPNLFIDSIVIADGQMIVEGHRV